MNKELDALLKMANKKPMTLDSLSLEALKKLVDGLVKTFDECKSVEGLEQTVELSKAAGVAACLSKEAAALSMDFQLFVEQQCAASMSRADQATQAKYGGN